MDKPRFLLINNYSMFASKDVWDSLGATIIDDFQYDVFPFAVDVLNGFFSTYHIRQLIISTAVSTRNNFTHVIFIGSTFIEDWVVASIQRTGIKVIYWSMEDPHAFDQNSRFMELADYYFTNERAVFNKFKDKCYYLPTAAGHTVCRPAPYPFEKIPENEKKLLDSEVFFGGNIYPNRQKILEPLIPHFEKHKIKFGIMGITSLMDDYEKSPLLDYIKGDMEGVVDHRWIIAGYQYSKFIINIERDPEYEYDRRYSSNRKYKIIGESLNPRAYEICLCKGGLQLIDDKRKELYEEGVLEPGKHCVVYSSPEDMIEKILYYREHEDERLKIVNAAYEHALKNHTYKSRALRMIDILNLKEGRRRDLITSVLSKLKNNPHMRRKKKNEKEGILLPEQGNEKKE